MVLSILALGIVASVAGRLFARWSSGFAIIAAVISLASGIAALAAPAIRIRFAAPAVERHGGVMGAFAYGSAYTVASITTGGGPLFLLLTVTAAIGRPAYGAALSLFYGAGRGLPFLLLGLAAGRAAAWVARMERGRRAAEIVSGIALVVLAGYFVRLSFQLA